MRVQVLQPHQLRQAPGMCRLDLAAVLARFGLDPRQAQSIHGLRRVPGDASCALEEAVLVQLQPRIRRQPAQGDGVRFGTGEIQPGSPETSPGHRPQVGLQAAGQHDAGPGAALGQHPLHTGTAGEALHHRRLSLDADQHVDVAHRVAPPARASGHLGLQHAGNRLEFRHEGCGDGCCAGQRHSSLALQPGDQRLQDAPFGLAAEAAQGADTLPFGGAPQVRQRPDAQRAVQRLRPLRPDAGKLQQFGEPGGHLPAQALQLYAAASGDDLRDLAGEVLADGRQGVEVFSGHQDVVHAAAQVDYRAGSVAVRAHPERIAALHLQQVGNLVEHGGDIGVGERHGSEGEVAVSI